MSEPLTREQVERLGEYLCEEDLFGVAKKVLDHDAAMRERVHDLQTANTWLAKRVDALQQQVMIMTRALRTLATIGGGGHTGNTIAQCALEDVATVSMSKDHSSGESS